MPAARRLVAIACLLVFSATAIPAGGAVAPEQPTVDNTVTRIQVAADGDARWVVVVRTRLETDDSVEQYRTFQDRFRNDTSRYLGPFGERIRSIVANAENATGRDMRASNFTARTSIQKVPRRWGVVVYEFTWTNFARQDGDTLVVDDIFQGGYYLAEHDILVVSAPPAFAVDAVAPPPAERRDDAVRWFGPREFTDRRPRVVFVSAPETTTESAPADTGIGTSPSALGGAVFVVLAGIVTAVWWTRRDDEMTAPERGGDSGATPEATTTAEVDSVQTDAERVEALLADAGGRMKQAAVGDALDWTPSKTSRVLSDMEDRGVVERTRIGRENVVDLLDE